MNHFYSRFAATTTGFAFGSGHEHARTDPQHLKSEAGERTICLLCSYESDIFSF